MNQEKAPLKLSDILKRKEDPKPLQEEAGRLTEKPSQANLNRGVEGNLCTYLSMSPTIDFENERKLEELH
jgi:hypothetical protein